MFRQQDNGFQITFSNGNTISVQFRYGTYCDNRYDEHAQKGGSCKNAEVACWNASGDWYPLQECDSVVGWVTPDKVAELIQLLKEGTDSQSLRAVLSRK